MIKPASYVTSHGGLAAGSHAAFLVEPDHLDTPRVIVSAAGTPVWRWDSTPFGDSPANESPTGAPAFAYGLRFPGQQYDPETQSHYNYFRDYEPGTGRYVQSDPIGLWGDFQTYRYAAKSPLRSIDPNGLVVKIESLGTGLSTTLPIDAPCKPGMTSNQKGRAGEFAMRMAVEALGYIFESSRKESVPGFPNVIPDGYARDPASGTRYVLDSKCGPCAGMTKNQKKTYPILAKGGKPGITDVILFWWK